MASLNWLYFIKKKPNPIWARKSMKNSISFNINIYAFSRPPIKSAALHNSLIDFPPLCALGTDLPEWGMLQATGYSIYHFLTQNRQSILLNGNIFRNFIDI